MKRTSIPAVHASQGNVFADLALPDAADLPIQAELSRLIFLQIKRLALTQIQAAHRLRLKQPDISKLLHGRHTGFSAERLFRILNAFDQDVQIVVRPRPQRARRHAHMEVVAA